MKFTTKGLPPFAMEYLEDGKKFYLRACEEEDDKDIWRDKAEEMFDWAAFSGVPREYIDFLKSQCA